MVACVGAASVGAVLLPIVTIYRARAALTLEEVRAHFAACGVARQKTPELLDIVSALPRNAAGKVLKAELRRDFKASAAVSGAWD